MVAPETALGSSGSDPGARTAADPGAIVSWGEILWDRYPDRPRLGGAPANLAYHLACLGRPVSLVSRVGDDAAGRAAIDQLAAAGVDVGAVQIDRARPTGAVDVAFDGDGEARYALQPGCAWEHIELDADAHARAARAAAICFGTLALRRGRAALEAALAALPPGAAVASDPNLRGHLDAPATLRWLLERVDVIKLNEAELVVLAAVSGVSDPVAWLLHRGARLVAITRGARGCRLHRGGEAVDHPGFLADPGGDSVGCGDAFTAVLLHLHLAAAPLDRIAAAACRYAAFVASRRGATPSIAAALVAEVRASMMPA